MQQRCMKTTTTKKVFAPKPALNRSRVDLKVELLQSGGLGGNPQPRPLPHSRHSKDNQVSPLWAESEEKAQRRKVTLSWQKSLLFIYKMKKEDFFLDPGKVLIATFATLKCTEFLTTVIPQNYQANRKLICFTHLIMSLGEKVSPVPLPSSQEKEIT